MENIFRLRMGYADNDPIMRMGYAIGHSCEFHSGASWCFLEKSNEKKLKIRKNSIMLERTHNRKN